MAKDIFDDKSGIIYFEAGDIVDENVLKHVSDKNISFLDILDINNNKQGSYIRDTFLADKNKNRNDALFEIYKIMRPGEPPTIESADNLFRSLFFDKERYDLSPVGRLKINTRLGLDTDLEKRVLVNKDILTIIKYLA